MHHVFIKNLIVQLQIFPMKQLCGTVCEVRCPCKKRKQLHVCCTLDFPGTFNFSHTQDESEEDGSHANPSSLRKSVRQCFSTLSDFVILQRTM